MAVLDIVIIVLYFAIILGIGFYFSKKKDTTDEYFLANRNIGWFVVGSALFASNIGSEHLVGLAGSGASSGVAVAQYEILASLMLLLLGWFFVPFYIKSGVATMPEFLEKRYSSSSRWYLSLLSIFAYVVTKIAVTIAAGGIVFEALMGIDFWTGAFLVVILTGAYTVFGGLRAVVYTETIQTIILLIGSLVVLFGGLNAIGGWNAMVDSTADGAMSLWKPMSHPDFPWTGMMFGAPILGIWYWCTDQNIVQRVLSAKDVDQARKGTIFAGFLKILPLFLFVVPGILAAALAKNGTIVLDSNDAALPAMVKQLLPIGLRGLVTAGLLAALMSSLASVFNSCSTLITLDIYSKLSPNESQEKLVRFGQLTTVVMVILGLIFIPFITLFGDGLFQSLQSIQGLISPPIASVFLLGVLFKRLNAQGAEAALGVGFVIGMSRFISTILGMEYTVGSWGEFIFGMNFLHFAALLFVVCTVVLIAVSLLTPAPTGEKAELIKQITYEKSEKSNQNVSRSEFFSYLLVGLVLIIWYLFS